MKQIFVFGKVFVLTFYEYLCTKETGILVRGCCRKILKILYKRKMAMCNNSMGFHSVIAFTTLNILSIQCFVRR